MKRILMCWLVLLNLSLLSASIQDSAFKEYDIRGVVGKDFVVEDAYELGCAIAAYFFEKDPAIQKIIVGADGRVHSPQIKEQVVNALLKNGLDVWDIGTCTTPLVNFGLHTFPVDAGLMITASHNPGEYNGVKMYLRKNKPIFGQEIKHLRDIYANKHFIKNEKNIGSYRKEEITTRYVEYIKNLFPKLVGKDIRAIVDCGNGAAGTVLPQLVQHMQWQHVVLLYPEVDGTYPHHIADPTVEKYMQDLKAELSNSTSELGLGFDGDCDRMAPMTKAGLLVKGDQLVAMLSKTILNSNPGGSIVFDISSSRAMHEDVKRWGGVPVMSATGVAQIKRKMSETNALLAGEISCHTFFKDRYFGFDDGVYSMMRLFELLDDTQSTLDELLAELTPAYSSPTYRIPCPPDLCLRIIDSLQKYFINRQDAELITIDGLRIHLPYGWAIVRTSKTEPVISMRLEGNTEEALLLLKQEFYSQMSSYLDCSILIN